MSEPAPNECPDCGNYFPLRTENGTCQKCLKLAAFKRGTADYEEHEVRGPCCCTAVFFRVHNYPEPCAMRDVWLDSPKQHAAGPREADLWHYSLCRRGAQGARSTRCVFLLVPEFNLALS